MKRKRISEFFHEDEFTCKCGCGQVLVDPVFLEKLTKARRIAGIPFHISSGFRCAAHNEAVGGTAQSGHKVGKAADIRARTVYDYKRIIFAGLVTGMEGISLGKGFAHLDSRDREMIRAAIAFTLVTNKAGTRST